MAKEGLSAKFGVVVFKASMLNLWGIHQPKKVHLPNMNTLLNLLLLHRGLFYERPIKALTDISNHVFFNAFTKLAIQGKMPSEFNRKTR